jgi:hypothetical protein
MQAQIEQTAAQLAEQLAKSHQRIMTVLRWATKTGEFGSDMTALQVASRLMQAHARAAAALKRLLAQETQHTITYVHTPLPPVEKSKTNGTA